MKIEYSQKFTNEDRQKIIGGSDIAVIMNMSRWKTPLKLWLEKTGEVEPDDLSAVEAVQLGTELEEFVAQKFSQVTGKQVRKQPKMYVHKDYPFMVAHVDRLITGSDELLECKTCSAFKKDEWEADRIPQEYILQVMWYLGITGRKKGYIACLIGGQSFVQKEIEFDQQLFDVMVEKAKEFWDKVQNNEPPEIQANDGELIQMMFPKSSEEILMSTDEDLDEAIARLQELKQELKDGDAEKKLLEAKIYNNIKGNLGVQTMRYIVTRKDHNGRKKFNEPLMIEDGVLDKYIMQGNPYQTLNVKLNPAYQAA